jgi:hypothetical protein
MTKRNTRFISIPPSFLPDDSRRGDAVAQFQPIDDVHVRRMIREVGDGVATPEWLGRRLLVVGYTAP